MRRRRLHLTIALLAIVLPSCKPKASQDQRHSEPLPANAYQPTLNMKSISSPEALGLDQGDTSGIVFGQQVHILPLHKGGITRKGATLAGTNSARLKYYGGPVLATMEIVQVNWGQGNFDSHVTATSTPSMASFFTQMLTSPLIPWLDSEYNTVAPVAPKTNQRIGYGHFLGLYSIAPKIKSQNLSDQQIQTELANQIAAGSLPAPSRDAVGQNNTYYAVFFPPHYRISLAPGAASCDYFCAYHGTIANAKGLGTVAYGVHPDMQAGSGCDIGCGDSTSVFSRSTSVASHELVEALTDPNVGIPQTIAAPIAWYDPANGEIGDICNGTTTTFQGCDGETYSVQTEYSNGQRDCIGWQPTACAHSDFAVRTSPFEVTVPAGARGQTTLATTKIGADGSASLVVDPTPAGLQVNLASSTIVAGASTVVTVATDPMLAVGSYPVTVRLTEGSIVRTADLTVQVVPSSPSPAIANGSFETGTLDGWTTAGSTAVETTLCHGSHACAQLGSRPATTGESAVSQNFTVPPGKSKLKLAVKVQCTSKVATAWTAVTYQESTAKTPKTLLAKTCRNTGQWLDVTGAVKAGHSYTITVINHDDGAAPAGNVTYVDDVLLQ